MSIYPHIPYFYIIQHIKSGKYYAGARWAKEKTWFSDNGCHPVEFMKPKGYQTSSELVAKNIRIYGLESFKVILIISEQECCMSVYDYETTFLQTNNIAGNSNWLNRHNNETDRNSIVMSRYGVSNVMHLQEFVNTSIENRKVALKQKYSVDHILKVPEIKAKQQKSCDITVKKRYGVSNVFQIEDVKIKSKNTLMANLGFDHPNKTLKNRERITYNNNKHVICEHCGKSVKKAMYFGSHGKFCVDNPFCEVKKNFFVVYNIHDLKSKKVESIQEYDDNWSLHSGKIYTVYDHIGTVKIVTSNLKKYCTINSISYKKMVTSYKENKPIKSSPHSNSKNNHHYVGWYCKSIFIKSLLENNLQPIIHDDEKIS